MTLVVWRGRSAPPGLGAPGDDSRGIRGRRPASPRPRALNPRSCPEDDRAVPPTGHLARMSASGSRGSVKRIRPRGPSTLSRARSPSRPSTDGRRPSRVKRPRKRRRRRSPPVAHSRSRRRQGGARDTTSRRSTSRVRTAAAPRRRRRDRSRALFLRPAVRRSSPRVAARRDRRASRTARSVGSAQRARRGSDGPRYRVGTNRHVRRSNAAVRSRPRATSRSTWKRMLEGDWRRSRAAERTWIPGYAAAARTISRRRGFRRAMGPVGRVASRGGRSSMSRARRRARGRPIGVAIPGTRFGAAQRASRAVIARETTPAEGRHGPRSRTAFSIASRAVDVTS